MGEIVARFEAIYREEPERPLIMLPALGKTLTASDIWNQHRSYVDLLNRSKVQSGDLLVCGCGNRPELVPMLLACRVADVTVLATDSGATESEIRQLCVRFGARALLTHATLPAGEETLTPVGPGLTLVRFPGEPARYPGTAWLKLTSGSSGQPRAVRTTEPQLVADGTQIMTAMGIRPEETQIAVIPLAHAYGLGVIVMPMLLQGTGMVLRESFIPPQLPADARQFGARRFPGVPFMFEYLAEHLAAHDWPVALTRIISAGARLDSQTVRDFHNRFGLKIHTYYGASETGGITYDDSDDVDDTSTVGRPLAGVSLSIHPMEGLPDGHGRVHVRSPAVADGYLDDGDSDFVDGGFLTGDTGCVGQDGRLTLGGRVSSFINVAGRKVRPDEVESVLREMPAVADVRVVGVTDPQRGQQVVACLVVRPGARVPSLVDVRQFCARHLAAHKIPRLLLLLESIPVNTRGKTDRTALEDLVKRGADGRP